MRRVAGSSLALLAALALAGCSPAEQGAVTLDESTGRPVLVVELCEDELVEAVTLRQVDADGLVGTPLWRVQTDVPQPIGRFVVGEVPDQWTEIDSFEEDDLVGRLHLEADLAGFGGTAAEHSVEFELDELRAGVFTADGSSSTPEEFEDGAEGLCSGNVFAELGLPDWVAPALIGGTLTFLVASVMLMVVQLRGIRRAEQPG